MEETRRQAYLQAMGIDCFMSVASATAPTPQSPASVVAKVPKPELLESVKATPKPGGRIARKSATVDSPASTPSPIASIQSQPTDTESSDLRFTLQFFRFGESLAVINELPYLAGAESGKEELTLLDRMLNALGKPPGRAVGAPELVFRWPLDETNPVAAKQRVEARQLLHGMLQGRIAQGRFAYLLVMAGCSEELLRPAGQAVGDQPVVMEELGCQAVFTHSLGAIVSVPALKRPVWQAIQPLVGILSNLQ